MKKNPRILLPRIANTVNKSNTDNKFSKPKELSHLQQNKNFRVLQDNLWKREGITVKALPYTLAKLDYEMELSSGDIEDTSSRQNNSRNQTTNTVL